MSPTTALYGGHDYRAYESDTCSIARTLAIVGDRWTLLVLRDVANGVRRFDELADHLGIARNVLAGRLATLTRAGLVERSPYHEPGERARHEYRLSGPGRELMPILLAIMDWGDRNLDWPDGPPTVVRHAGCGAPIKVSVTCEEGHDLGQRPRLSLEPGPGSRVRSLFIRTIPCYNRQVMTQIIVLNGGSSSGKTAIARCLQSILPRPWLRLGVDDLIEALPPALLEPGSGIAFGQRGEVDVGGGFREAESAWMAGVAAMARAGTPVIVEDVFLGGAASQQRTRARLDGLDVLWVGVRCDPEIAAAREGVRGDRAAGMAASQAELAHIGVRYDVEVDTSHADPMDCARVIAARVT